MKDGTLLNAVGDGMTEFLTIIPLSDDVGIRISDGDFAQIVHMQPERSRLSSLDTKLFLLLKLSHTKC